MGREPTGELRLRVGLCFVWFKVERNNGKFVRWWEWASRETSMEGNFSPSTFLFLPAWFHFPPCFISLVSQPGPMTGYFYYAFTNPLQCIPFVTPSFPSPPFSFFSRALGLPVGFITIVSCYLTSLEPAELSKYSFLLMFLDRKSVV